MSRSLSVEAQAEIRSLAQWIKDELRNEYDRMSPERAQRTVSVFELTVYSPTIEETWKRSGISRLKTDGVLDQKWQEPLEAVVYNAGKIPILTNFAEDLIVRLYPRSPNL